MKKIIVVLLLSLLFLFVNTPISRASTLYSNDFKNNISDFNFYFGTCSTSSNGITCVGKPGETLGAAGITKTSYPTAKCVSFDATNADGIPQVIVSDSILNNRIITSFHSGENVQVYLINSGETHWDTGVAVPNGKHNLQLCEATNHISVYIDNVSIWEQNVTFPHFDHLGFYVQQGTVLTNFTVTDILPSQSQLNVPLLKQISDPWQGNEYDTGHLWNPANPTINAWGCAMTSAAMVFQYHGIKKLPDGTILNPGTLNTWLKNQPDGYVGTGWVNWIALSRLSKLATGINNITTFDALEYKRTSGANKTQLTTDISSSLPDILEEPGHFIVAKGINGSTYDINDPYYNRTLLTDGYSNSFLSLGRYVPSHTDLSYIMIVTNPNIDIQVKDQNGNSVGEQFVQNSIVNPLNGVDKNQPIKIYYLPTPATGNYQIQTTNNNTSSYDVTAYLYDVNGETNIQKVTTVSQNTFNLSFDKTSNTNSTIKKVVTFDIAISDVKQAKQLHLINNGLADSLIGILEAAKKLAPKNNTPTQKLIEVGIKMLNESNGKKALISPEALTILLYDFNSLSQQL